MNRPPRRPVGRRGVAVLWTGVKDCTLALHRTVAAGIPVSALVTFAPPGQARFRAHPLPVVAAQAAALGLEHRVVRVRRPYSAGYAEGIRQLAADGFNELVSGDIAPVAGGPSWLEAIAAGSGVRVTSPLWGTPRGELLGELVRTGITAVVSFLRSPPLEPAWLGEHLSPPMIRRLIRAAREGSFDASGEQGEYHTWVLDAPLFSGPVRLGPTRSCRLPGCWYLSLREPRGAGVDRRPKGVGQRAETVPYRNRPTVIGGGLGPAKGARKRGSSSSVTKATLRTPRREASRHAEAVPKR